MRSPGSCLYKVKTTAYSHTEADHIRYARGSATGNALKYGNVRSAAADWSVFPVGTLFKISGQPYIYEVDDYGRALVGTKTIDLYQPSQRMMRDWGTRNVNIQVLRWGSFSKSLDILEERQRHAHVRAMISNILRKNRT
jgi:3D (Asp-Asp-Asp) domain-containing protein